MATEETQGGSEKRSDTIVASTWEKIGRPTVTWIRSGPVSVILASLTLLTFLVALIFPGLHLEVVASGGWDGPWWDLLSAPLAVRSLAQLLLDLLLLLTLGIFLEHAMGWRNYLIVGLVSYWGAGLAALGVSILIGAADPVWGEALRTERYVGIVGFLLAVAAASSVRLAPLWRRRLQTFVITVLLILVLFGGYLSAIFTVLAALFGLVLGYFLYGRAQPGGKLKEMVGAGPQDGRFLVALIVAGVVVGTLVTYSNTHLVGILAHMQYAASGTIDAAGGAACSQTALDNCGYYQGLAGVSGLQVLVPGMMQLALAWGLRRGRRSAWVGTVLLQGLTLVLASVNLGLLAGSRNWDAFGLDAVGHSLGRLAATIAVPLIILILVVPTRSLFPVKTKSAFFRLLRTHLVMWTVGSWVAALLLGLLVTGFRDASTTLLGGTAAYLLGLLPAPSLAVDIVPQTLAPVASQISGALALVPWVVAMILLLRSYNQQELPEAISRPTFMELTRQYGGESFGWISTWEGNNYWVAPGLLGAVAYRASGGVALTVTDPVAAPGQLESVMKDFVSFALQQGLVPAFYSVHQEAADIAGKWGWPRLEVAEETVLDLPELSFAGKKYQVVRSSLNRAEREGIHAQWVTWDSCSQDWKDQIQAISEQWVDDKPLPEMGFTLGGMKELADAEVPILLAVNEEGVVHGVTSWMPIYKDDKVIGFTLDFMRRLEDGFRPVMEFLIASAALWAKEEGYQVLSMSGAPLAHATTLDKRSDTADSVQALDRVLNLLGETLEPVYGFRSLLRFKAKFRPRYQPMYLAVPTLGSLPFVGLAIGHAYLPNLKFSETMSLSTALRGK